MKNSLFSTLIHLKGNPRVCVYTEPLWGLSMNLCIPYASVYMLAIGLKDSQIGLVASVFMLSQVVFAFLSGPITDKIGRRKATAIFDFIAWSVPCLIWWKAGSVAAFSFWFFFAAALLNGAMQIPTNSWECLLIEDADKKQITHINSLVVVGGQLSVIFTPISAILFSKLTLIPAIRILYVNAFFVMTLKVLILYLFSRETKMGIIRLKETANKSLFSITAGYTGVLKIISKSPGTIFALAISILTGIVSMINTTFWQVIVTERLLIPAEYLPISTMIKSIVTIIFLFLAAPHLAKGSLKKPLLSGFACFFTGQIILIFTPIDGNIKYMILFISMIFDSFAAGYLFMLAKSLIALNVNPEERARIHAILNLLIIAAVAPFGWIGGLLSNISRIAPFILNLCLLTTGFFITLFNSKVWTNKTTDVSIRPDSCEAQNLKH